MKKTKQSSIVLALSAVLSLAALSSASAASRDCAQKATEAARDHVRSSWAIVSESTFPVKPNKEYQVTFMLAESAVLDGSPERKFTVTFPNGCDSAPVVK